MRVCCLYTLKYFVTDEEFTDFVANKRDLFCKICKKRIFKDDNNKEVKPEGEKQDA